MQIQNNMGEVQEDEERLNEQIHELGLKVNTGEEFEVDRKQIDMLLNQILSYPSTAKVRFHCDSNRLGQLDFHKQERYRRVSDTDAKIEDEYQKICNCCGFIMQSRELEVCSHGIKDITSLGISTYVYFQTIFNVAILLGVMFLIYSLYSIGTNIKASLMEIDGNNSNQMLNYLSISLGSKEMFSSGEKQKLYVVGIWIGCAMLLLWGAIFMWLKYYQKGDQVKILMETKTAAQFSLVIEKMPTGLTKQEVQEEFTKYLARLKEYDNSIKIQELEIEKYNEGKPFYFNEDEFKSKQLKDIMDVNKAYRGLFIDWILERRNRDSFSRNDKHRKRKYQEYQRNLDNKQKICDDIINRIKQEYKKKNKESKTTVFITFATNRQKNLVLDYNPQDIISKIKDYIPFLKSQNRFIIRKNGITYDLKIFPAPDPEDIVWANIGVSSCEKVTRKILTFTITMVMLAISFVIVYSLSSTQVQNRNNFYLSILISLSISIINLLIIQVIQLLTKYERDYTMTNYQTSLAIKSIAAQVLNTIFVPFIAAYFIKKNIYGPNGLIEDVFILAITNSFVAPLVKLIDPYYYLRYFYSQYKLQPSEKLWSHQFELNELCERLEFEVGYEYIYLVNLFIFTCFYVSLQPIIPIIAIFGLIFMHWAQKYSLYKRCQRPVPGTKILSTTMSQLIYFGAIAYSLGSLTWANFLPQNASFDDSIPPNLVSASFAFTIFVFPYEIVFRKCFQNKRMPQVFYISNRIFFTSEYDRLNPSTAESGIREYRQFLQNKKKELAVEKPDVKNRLSLELQLNNRPNFFKQNNNGLFVTFKKNPETIYQNLINRQAQNILTPQMIANVILPNNKMSLSRTNFRNLLPAIKLNRIRSTIPRANLNLEMESVIKHHQLEPPASQEHFINARRVESINFNQLYNEERTDQLEESKVEKYLPDISNVKSVVIKCEEDPKNIPDKRNKENSELNLKTGRPKFVDSVIMHDKVKGEENSNMVISEHKKSNFRESMIKEMSASLRCNQEVPNRFAINAENIIPLCVDEKEDINFGESLIKFYELGDFQ